MDDHKSVSKPIRGKKESVEYSSQLNIRKDSSPQKIVSPIHPSDYQLPAQHTFQDTGPGSVNLDIPTPKVDPQLVDNQRLIYATTWPVLTEEAFNQYPDFAKLHTTVKSYNLPNLLGAKQTIDSGLCLDSWENELRGYHDAEMYHFLHYSWPIGYHRHSPRTSVAENHMSATQYPTHIQHFIDTELPTTPSLGRLTLHHSSHGLACLL